jgi:hypothetical protein
MVYAGDYWSPTRLFLDWYYSGLSEDKPLNEVLFLGVHAVRLAHMLKRSYIGAPNAWFFSKGSFRRLKPPELRQYVKRSEMLDENILKIIHDSPFPPIFDILLK